MVPVQGGREHWLRPRLATAAVGAVVLILVVWVGNPWLALVVLVVGSVALAELRNLLRRATKGGLLRWAGLSVGAIYIGGGLFAAVLVREVPLGREWLAVALLGTFATDTAAFLVGRTIGRRQMAPRLSPNKTWEGAVGGLVFGASVSVGIVEWLNLPLSVAESGRLCLSIALVAQLGDLAESWIKRRAGVKNSGGLLPGHGGLLDRLDSLVPVFPFVYWMARS